MKVAPKFKSFVFTAVFASLVLVISGCSAEGSALNDDDVAGFAYDADQAEVNDAINGLDPVTLNYQPAAYSSQSPQGEAAELFKAEVEERSNGQIALDIVWGRAIAGIDEVDDALVDGRVDISATTPSYDPSAYPVHNAFSQATTGFPTSPVVGNAVSAAVLTELAYKDEITEEFEEKGLVPLHASIGTSTYYSYCPEPIKSRDDWKGLQIRVGGQQHHTTMELLGASPVSMSVTESYDALQRGTIDCDFGRVTSNFDHGIAEAGPHIGYSDEQSAYADIVNSSLVAGTTYMNLPLPYKQIIFDSLTAINEGSLQATLDSMAQTVELAIDSGGSIEEYDEETKEVIRQANEEFRNATMEEGVLSSDFLDSMDSSIEHWREVVKDLGYEDGGSMEDVNSWYSAADIDWSPLVERIQEDVLLEHRPE